MAVARNAARCGGGGMTAAARGRGLLFGAAGVAVFSPDALLLRLMDCDNTAAAAMRAGFLALTTGLLTAAFPAWRRGFSGGRTWLYAAVFAAGLICFPLAIKNAPAANVLVITAVNPLIAAAAAFFILRERTAGATWAAAAIVAAGIALIFYDSRGGGGALGNMLALGAAAAWALNSVIVRGRPDMNVLPGLFLGALAAAALCAVFADWRAADAADAGWALLSGGVIAAAAWLLITAAARRLPPPEVNLLFLLETILGPFWVWLALAEAPPLATFAAAALILPTLALHAAWQLRRGRA